MPKMGTGRLEGERCERDGFGYRAIRPYPMDTGRQNAAGKQILLVKRYGDVHAVFSQDDVTRVNVVHPFHEKGL